MIKPTTTLTALAALTFVGAAGNTALAKTGQDGLKGNQGCYVHQTDAYYDNPGKMFQAMREATGDNPAQVAKSKPAGQVGEWISRRCVEDDID